MNKFSVFPHAKETTKSTTITLKQAFDVIQKGGKGGNLKKLIESIRSEPDKDKRNQLKMQLPCICFCGEFSKRNKDSIINHSGLICLDFDGIPDDVFQDFYERIITDKYTRMAFLSPSGKGYKVVVAIPADIEKHEQYFQGLAEHYNSPYFDQATKDVSRICYASYDDYAFINLESDVFTNAVDLSKRAIPAAAGGQTQSEQMDDIEALQFIHKRTNADVLYAPGSKHDHLIKFTGRAILAGIDPDVLVHYYEQNHDKKDVDKIVKNLYKNYSSDFGKNPLLKRSVSEKQTESDEISYMTFWFVQSDKAGNTWPKFNRTKFLNWLKLFGWARYHLTDKEWQLVRIENNVVTRQAKPQLKKFVFQYMEMLPDKFDGIRRNQLVELIMKGAASFFSSELLDFLPDVVINTHMDNRECCWLYYRNSAVKITKEDNQLIPYNAINHKIWYDQILQRDCDVKGSLENEFMEFVSKISGFEKYGDDKEVFQRRMNAFETTIGYLLHGYKDRATAKAPILNDAFNPTGDPRGGTGKGIFLSAIRSMKETVLLDGKIWTPDKSFAYQEVHPSTQILAIDDVKKDFKFDRLFSLITEGVTVEKKGMEAYKIPFESSPKVVILTNYPLQGDGNSHERRRHELELDDFFITSNPIEHFGHRLFDDWTDDDWKSFDRYMIFCIRRYLISGLVGLDTSNLKLRRLRELTHPVFVDWFTDIIEPKRYALQHLHTMLSNFNSDFSRYSQVKITKWIKRFAEFYQIDYKTGRISHEGRLLQSIEFTNLGNLKLVEVGNSDSKLVKSEVKKTNQNDDDGELPF